jgi:hypothetical protein
MKFVAQAMYRSCPLDLHDGMLLAEGWLDLEPCVWPVFPDTSQGQMRKAELTSDVARWADMFGL